MEPQFLRLWYPTAGTKEEVGGEEEEGEEGENKVEGVEKEEELKLWHFVKFVMHWLGKLYCFLFVRLFNSSGKRQVLNPVCPVYTV